MSAKVFKTIDEQIEILKAKLLENIAQKDIENQEKQIAKKEIQELSFDELLDKYNRDNLKVSDANVGEIELTFNQAEYQQYSDEEIERGLARADKIIEDDCEKQRSNGNTWITWTKNYAHYEQYIEQLGTEIQTLEANQNRTPADEKDLKDRKTLKDEKLYQLCKYYKTNSYLLYKIYLLFLLVQSVLTFFFLYHLLILYI